MDAPAGAEIAKGNGNICWAELATRDPTGAKRFYQGLFDWTFQDIPLGEGGLYSLAKVGGRDAAGLYPLDAADKSAITRWCLFVSVTDADAAMQRALELGAKAVAPPQDFLGSGRYALLTDPSGADIGLWQAKSHAGFGASGQPGTVAFSELVTLETEAARRFYCDWLGWTVPSPDTGTFTLFLNGTGPVAGMVRMDPARGIRPPHWRLYFKVVDCAAAVERARLLGAACQVPATSIPGVGTVAMLSDPQGGGFALMQPPA